MAAAAITSAKQLTDSIRNADLEGLIEALEAHPNLLNFQPGVASRTPLMRIINQISMENVPDDDYYTLIDELINRGADLNLKDKDGNTALHLAVNTCDSIVIESLLEAGANINLKNKDGDTALHLAVVICASIVTKDLLEAGADKTILNNNGKSPLDFANELGDDEIIDLFFLHPPGNEPPREPALPPPPPPGRPPGGNVGGGRTRRRRSNRKRARKMNRLKSRRRH